MSEVDVVLGKIAKFDAESNSSKQVAAQGWPDFRWRMVHEANRLIDDAMWNDYQGDVTKAIYCRYLAQAYINFVKESAQQANQ